MVDKQKPSKHWKNFIRKDGLYGDIQPVGDQALEYSANALFCLAVLWGKEQQILEAINEGAEIKGKSTLLRAYVSVYGAGWEKFCDDLERQYPELVSFEAPSNSPST